MQESIKSIFSEVKDPRVENRYKHKLIDILFIRAYWGFCTLLSNGDDFEDMAMNLDDLSKIVGVEI